MALARRNSIGIRLTIHRFVPLALRSSWRNAVRIWHRVNHRIELFYKNPFCFVSFLTANTFIWFLIASTDYFFECIRSCKSKSLKCKTLNKLCSREKRAITICLIEFASLNNFWSIVMPASKIYHYSLQVLINFEVLNKLHRKVHASEKLACFRRIVIIDKSPDVIQINILKKKQTPSILSKCTLNEILKLS